MAQGLPFHRIFIRTMALEMYVAPTNTVENHRWILLDGLCRHLLCYTHHQDTVDEALDEQMAATLNKQWCFHGTSLTTARKVFDEQKLRAGCSTESGNTGVFVP